jgi:hypothetical protein
VAAGRIHAKSSRATRAGRPTGLAGHDLCPGCHRRLADSLHSPAAWREIQESIRKESGVAKLSKKEAERILGWSGPKQAPGRTESPSVLASLILMYCRSRGYPEPAPEHEFHPVRKWKFDFAWPEFKIALEVEGVLPGEGGRHQRASGYEGDCSKYSEASLLGWTVLRATPRMVRAGEAWGWLDRALGAREPHPNQKGTCDGRGEGAD